MIKWVGLGILRYLMLLVALLGVLGLLNGRWVVALLVLSIPGIYFGRFAWRGYRASTSE